MPTQPAAASGGGMPGMPGGAPGGMPGMPGARGTMTPTSGGRSSLRAWGSWDGKMVDKNYNGRTTSKLFGSTMSPQGELNYPEPEKPLGYAPGSPERAALEKELEQQSKTYYKVPVLCGNIETWNEDDKVIIKTPTISIRFWARSIWPLMRTLNTPFRTLRALSPA